MENNYKQKIYSALDDLTQHDLDQYIKDRNINLKRDKLLDKLSRIHKPEDHYYKISDSIGKDLNKTIMSYYNLGMAWAIAFVLECFYDDKYKIKDLKEYLHEMIKTDPELKEMVYDCIKDF